MDFEAEFVRLNKRVEALETTLRTLGGLPQDAKGDVLDVPSKLKDLEDRLTSTENALDVENGPIHAGLRETNDRLGARISEIEGRLQGAAEAAAVPGAPAAEPPSPDDDDDADLSEEERKVPKHQRTPRKKK